MKLIRFVTICAYFLICLSFKNKIFVQFNLGLSSTVRRAFIFTPCPGFGFSSVIFCFIFNRRLKQEISWFRVEGAPNWSCSLSSLNHWGLNIFYACQVTKPPERTTNLCGWLRGFLEELPFELNTGHLTQTLPLNRAFRSTDVLRGLNHRGNYMYHLL